MSNQHTNLKKINIELLCLMLEYGVKRLVENYRYIDELNVFPVPDGDTGTNMKITVETGYEAIKKQSFEDIFLLGKTFTRNLLLGARGNSGVITSQIFKGFFKYIPEQTKEIDISMLVMCFAGAKETSYKAVITPVEGTMLTIIRVVSEMLCKDEKKIDNIEQMFEKIVNIAEQTLIKTPELLPELKEAGVVDSGAYGVCRIFEGMKYAINLYTGTVNSAKPTSSSNEIQETKSSSNEFVDNNEGFGYCNEFIMTIGSRVEASQKQKEKFDEHKFKKQLEKMGESIVFVRDEELVKVHIHTPSP
jgi:DAK2 domain fusion protein YloV